jgi:hypothetical protein
MQHDCLGNAVRAVNPWGRNIFNKEYEFTENFFVPGTKIAQADAPATFGVHFGY